MLDNIFELMKTTQLDYLSLLIFKVDQLWKQGRS